MVGRAVALGVVGTLAFVAACGGKVLIEADGSAGGSSPAGSPSYGGSPPAKGGAPSYGGGPTAKGGSPSYAGAPSVAGAPGYGGGSNCGAVACPAIACGPGSIAYLPPGSCCPSCQLCGGVACAPCPVGTHYVSVPNSCCGTCVSDPPDPCTMGREAYLRDRAQFEDKYSFGCTSSADCVQFNMVNACEGCYSAVAVRAAVDSFVQNLGSVAKMDCMSCPAPVMQPCASGVVECFDNRCVLGIPLPVPR